MNHRIFTIIEIATVILWTLLVTAPYLNMDVMVIPGANEFRNEYLTTTQAHHVWTRAKECGWCALWYGNVRGGYPAFADPYTSMMHPLVMVTNLLWGVRNGTKLALVGAFLMAGLAQWWLASVLGVGRVARTWGACLLVAASGLSARMEPGFFGMVVSGAACALVLPPLVAVGRGGSMRMTVLLGVTLALAVLSGQGYLQIGLACTLPAVLIVMPSNRERFLVVLRRYAMAGLLAVLLAAPFLVPFIHFSSQFSKTSEPGLPWAQQFTYVLLNLVNNDRAFYYELVKGIIHHPGIYANYIGWIPVLAGLWAVLRGGRNSQDWRAIIFLLVIAFLPLWLASSVPLPFLIEHGPESLAERVSAIRFNSLIAPLAVPPILGLAAIGLDRLLDVDTLRFQVGTVPVGSGVSRRWLSLDVRWVLIIPIILSLVSAWSFARNWIVTTELPAELYAQLEQVQTADLQWVAVPGEYKSPYVEPGVGMGLKLSNGFHSWRWKDRPDPIPFVEIVHDRGESRVATTYESMVAESFIRFASPGVSYATVFYEQGGQTDCTAQGAGGEIDVNCYTEQPGVLQLQERFWSGWQVRVDGQPAELHADEIWLTLDLPPGNHLIQVRYRPWDVPVGLVLCATGVVFAFYLWKKGE